MKTILVDAWNTLITKNGVDPVMKELLDQFPNPKIIVTNANAEEQRSFGMVNLPYPLYSMNHHPDKTDPYYFECLLKAYDLKAEDTLYFEHNADAVASSASAGITAYWFNKNNRDLDKLRQFLESSLKS
jgi:HAD superfamily hydrolase (TIGR01509 family)